MPHPHKGPDVGFDAADFDVGFIRVKDISFLVRIVVNEGFDADSGGLAVVGDLLVGDGDIEKVFQSLRSFAQGQSEVDMQGQVQGHDMCVVLTEFQGRRALRQGV